MQQLVVLLTLLLLQCSTIAVASAAEPAGTLYKCIQLQYRWRDQYQHEWSVVASVESLASQPGFNLVRWANYSWGDYAEINMEYFTVDVGDWHQIKVSAKEFPAFSVHPDGRATIRMPRRNSDSATFLTEIVGGGFVGVDGNDFHNTDNPCLYDHINVGYWNRYANSQCCLKYEKRLLVVHNANCKRFSIHTQTFHQSIESPNSIKVLLNVTKAVDSQEMAFRYKLLEAGNTNAPKISMNNGNKTYDATETYKFNIMMRDELRAGQSRQIVVGELYYQNGHTYNREGQPFAPETPCYDKRSEFGLVSVKSTMCCEQFQCVNYSLQADIMIGMNRVGGIEAELDFRESNVSVILNVGENERENGTAESVLLNSFSEGIVKACKLTPDNSRRHCMWEVAPSNRYQLSMRTSKYPFGFRMLDIDVLEKEIVKPYVINCVTVTRPYNDPSEENIRLETKLCCNTGIQNTSNNRAKD